MVMSRYEFLAQAHAIVKPRTYLEIGVQLGSSLALAEAAEVAIGIDPYPMVRGDLQRPNQRAVSMTSGAFFQSTGDLGGMYFGPMVDGIDFAFIDGSHLFEDALRDFLNVERYLTGKGSVVFFDDVLPYSAAIATREQPPGDWTGDVWKVIEILEKHREDLDLSLIDVAPTGLLMVQSEYWPHRSTPEAEYRPHDAIEFAQDHAEVIADWLARGELSVPDDILNRVAIYTPEHALEILERY